MSQDPTTSAWRTPRSAVLCAVLVGSVLRLACLGSKSLWIDEVLSLNVARQGIEPLLAGTVEAYHPPLYFLILGGWLKLGDSVAHIRLLSALAGILAIPVLYLVTKDLLNRKVAVSAAWFGALAPLLIWYAQEARDYSLLLLLSLLSLLGLVRWVVKPRWYWWGLFVVSTTAALYTHYSALLTLAVQVLVLAALLARKRGSSISLGYVGAGWIAVALLYLPWLNTPAAQRLQTILTTNTFYVSVLAAGRTGLPDGLEFLLDLNLPRMAVLITLCGLMVALACVWATFRVIRSKPGWLLRLRDYPPVRYLVLGCFVLLLALSVIPRGYTVKRYTLVLWPVILIAIAWMWPWRRDNKRALAVLLGLSLLASLANVFVVPKSQWKEAAQLVLTRQEPGDGVLLSPPYVGQCFRYYAQEQIPLAWIKQDGIDEALAQTFETYPRLWFVTDTADVDANRASILVWLGQHARKMSSTEFYRVQVDLYQLK